MGKIAERIADVARKCGDLSPLAEPVRQRLWDGNKATILSGTSPGSTARVAPLRPSTLARRKGSGPPRAENGASARVVTGCVIVVRAGQAQLSFTKAYPDFAEVAGYLDRGTARMIARPFSEFREIDREWIKRQMRGYVIGGGFRGFVSGLSGR